MAVYDPWADLASRPHITFGVARLPLGQGWWMPDVPGIALDDRLSRVQRRCVLAHELAHVDLDHDRQCAGQGSGTARLAAQMEIDADLLAARRLVDLSRFAEVAAWTRDHAEAAEELDVTPAVLATRIAHLHPAERGYLARAASLAEHVA